MSNTFSTIILIPFFAAFLTFVLRFYFRENASSMANPSFLLAGATVLSAGAYLVLKVTETLPTYGTTAFALLGLALLGLAIARMFRI